MHRLLIAAVAAGLLMALTVPAFADEASSTAELADVTDCDNAEQLAVLTPAGLTTGVAAPAFDVFEPSLEATRVLVDLGDDVAATAEITAALTWGVALNDFDLTGTSAASDELSDRYQPEEALEEVVTLAVADCEVIELTVLNFFAPLASIDEPSLTLEIVDDGPAAAELADAELPVVDDDALARVDLTVE